MDGGGDLWGPPGGIETKVEYGVGIGGESNKQQDFSENSIKILSYIFAYLKSEDVDIDVFIEYHFRKRRYRRTYKW